MVIDTSALIAILLGELEVSRKRIYRW